MKKLGFYILFLILMPLISYSQVSEIMKLMSIGEYDKVKTHIDNIYQDDTNNIDRYYLLYNYYIDSKNPNVDSLIAYSYLIKYNNKSKKKIETSSLAQSLLPQVYKTKDIDKFNTYIQLTEDYADLNKEAKRIRNQLAYENAVESNDINVYKNFINSYPDAMQIEEAKNWVNEYLLQWYIQQSNIDSLKNFALNTNSETYKEKAIEEIDKIAFTNALKENTIDSYISYINEYPNGNYISMAKINLEKAQYQQYVSQGNITDMLYYLNEKDFTDKNYKEVVAKLTLLANSHYNILAMKKVNEINSDDKTLDSFVKRYISDLDLTSLQLVEQEFENVTHKDYFIEAKQKAEILQTLNDKSKLTMEDYKKHKNLFKSLNANMTSKVFARFEQLNSTMPKNKAIDFKLNDDIQYIQYKNAQQSELNFILTESNMPITSNHTNIKFIAKADTNGYGWYEGNKNKDIYYSILEKGIWSEYQLLPFAINSRQDESNAVLSKNKQILWFSSDKGLNFGGKDIYISVRKDTNDWNNWSNPILLGEDFNTETNDYVVAVTDNLIILTQDDNFEEQNNIYLEGNTNIPFVYDEVITKDINDKQNVRINILDKENMTLINTVATNENGNYAFIIPNQTYVLSAQKRHFYSPIVDSAVYLYKIEDIIAKRQLITIDSPFDNQGKLTIKGKKELENISNTFKDGNYILTIGVHCVSNSNDTENKALSDKESKQIVDILVKNGMSRENIIAKGYGNTDMMQGWEDKDCLDIGLISK